MSFDLGRRLLLAGSVAPHELRRALWESVMKNKPFPRALADISATARLMFDGPLDADRFPTVNTVNPSDEMLALLPPEMLQRWMVMPLRKDPRTNTVDLAMVDPTDTHVINEVGLNLGLVVRPLAAPLREMERALLLVPGAAPKPQSAFREAENELDEDVIVPLVRRARPGTRGGSTTQDLLARPKAEIEPVANSTSAPSTVPFEAANPSPPASPRLANRQPPFESLTTSLERIDAATERSELLDHVLDALMTTATRAALFVPRKGNFSGVASQGGGAFAVLESTLTVRGIVADALTRGERVASLDAVVDFDLRNALELTSGDQAPVLVRVVYLGARPALLMVAVGIGDIIEASRRSAVLATVVSNALTRLIRGK
jgi:hypothetical protein